LQKDWGRVFWEKRDRVLFNLQKDWGRVVWDKRDRAAGKKKPGFCDHLCITTEIFVKKPGFWDKQIPPGG